MLWLGKGLNLVVSDRGVDSCEGLAKLLYLVKGLCIVELDEKYCLEGSLSISIKQKEFS